MQPSLSRLAVFACLLAALPYYVDFLAATPTAPTLQQGKDVPTDWIERDTGHRVIRLSKEGGTQSFYFHQYPYTEKGDKLVVSSKKGFAAIDLTMLGKAPRPAMEVFAPGKNVGNPIVGKKSRQIYYITGGTLYASHIDTKETKALCKLPKGYGNASGLALNADETLIASTANDPDAKEKAKIKDQPKNKNDPVYMVLFTANTKTGKVKKIHYANAWLNHTQFSPTDPNQILFCHEGTWDYVDRIWTIRADGTGLRKVHNRSMNRELFGHEFFGSDGKWIWYDLQTPRSTEFWVGGFNLQTGERIRYGLERSQWSVHFNQSHDGKLFAGDGGGPNSVANRTLDGTALKGPGNGQWTYLFTPEKRENLKETTVQLSLGKDEKNSEKWLTGKFQAEKLVDMSKHNYSLEPNVTFTPDDKWVVFRSNLHGASHVYAVEVKKTK